MDIPASPIDGYHCLTITMDRPASLIRWIGLPL